MATKHPWLAEVIAAIEADRRAGSRRIDRVTVHPRTWSALGEPIDLVLASGAHVPIHPTGRTLDRFTWYYARAPRRWKANPRLPRAKAHGRP